MKIALKRIVSILMTAVLSLCCLPFFASASNVTYSQIVNAATTIIIKNEGFYDTVVKNDNGALSIGVIGWHATNALNLLKDIVSANPSQALSILGSALYNEIITSSYWETRIPSSGEASAISVLISTAEGKKIQNSTAASYISGYVTHGQKLGITEPEALVFFADYQNQNGYSGAESFFYSVRSSYGTVNLINLYNGSSRNTRRTRTYNFCATLNWSDYTNEIAPSGDTTAPEISNVIVSELTEAGYSVSCKVKDNTAVTAVFFAVYYKADGVNKVVWYSQKPEDGSASHTVNISEFANRAGEYCTYIYAFDGAGNYAYVELNTITVPEKVPETPKLSLTVSSNITNGEKGSTIKWSAGTSGGSGNYTYAFSLYRNDTLIEKRNYVDYSDFSYTANETGSYRVTVSVMDSVSMLSATEDSLTTEICTPIVIDSFTSNKTAAMLGESVLWTVSASGGEGNLMYSYTVYRDDSIIYSGNFSSGYRFSYKPTEGGVYNVTVSVKDERNQVKSAKSGNVTIICPLAADNVTFSKSYAIAGSSVTCSADIVGGTGDFTCVFSIYCNGELVISSDSADSETFTFTVSKAGNYTAEVTVTDADSTVTTASGGNLTAEETAMKGDANCDGKVNASDARFALRCSAGLDKPESGLEYALDINGDGKCTAADARIILRVAAQLQTF